MSDLGQPASEDGRSKKNVDLAQGQESMELELAQGTLGFEVAVAEKLEERGIYDTTRLKSRKPEIHKACVKCVMMGVSPGTTADLLSLDIRTVNAVVAELEVSGTIPPYKERTVWQLRAVVTLAIDQLIERAKDGKLGALDVAILIDKIELLSGNVTSRSEVRMTPEEEEFMRFMHVARRSLPESSGMVFEAEILPQKPAFPAHLGAPSQDKDC